METTFGSVDGGKPMVVWSGAGRGASKFASPETRGCANAARARGRPSEDDAEIFDERGWMAEALARSFVTALAVEFSSARAGAAAMGALRGPLNTWMGDELTCEPA
jgi:hypothetical protein